MFESDDFDQVLSQFDFAEVATVKLKEKENENINSVQFIHKTKSVHQTEKPETPTTCIETEVVFPRSNSPIKNIITEDNSTEYSNNTDKVPSKENKEDNSTSDTFLAPKHAKRRIINSYFDHQSKRKFPGPAGLLTGTLEVPKDDSICQIELLSQDIDYSEHNLQKDLFESPIWNRLLSDIQSWKLSIDTIKAIKQQAVAGNLRKRKAQNVTAFVEAVDRSAIDPLIILRDATGSIKCTLHRDAWSSFSQFIVSDYCAVILQKPTVLTTGGAFKKHYLNITLSNILAIYSSTVPGEDGNSLLPDGYSFLCKDEFTVIKTDRSSDSIGTTSLEQTNGAEDLMDGLDSFFSDDVF